MTDAVPARIGPHEIVREIGRGGMGVVYLARDTRLERDVAIKTLPPELVADPERLARFEREAKLLASLNHPNIATVLGLEEVDGHRYLVLEYVEGETLAEWIARGPIPVAEALPIAKQIAEAVEEAHARGVIHRDLKPANIKCTPGDRVKVLDFGLAKAFDQGPASSTAIATSPTYVPTTSPTIAGVVLGTAGYLSPEQARGRPVDKRTDIFSFGCVLYEMLTGAIVFPGETVTDSLGATLHREPAWDRLPPDTPPTIRLLLRRCLTKDRKRRLHDIADARVEIEEALVDPSGTSLGLPLVDGAGAARPSGRRGILGIGAGLLVGAVLVGAVAFALRPAPETTQVRRFAVAPGVEPGEAAISPDGTMVAYSVEGTVHLRRLDSLADRTVWANEDTIDGLFWSPDAQWLGAQVRRKIYRIAVTGGEAVQIADQLMAQMPCWTDDGSITMAEFVSGGIVRIPARGGEARTVIEKTPDELHLHAGGPLPGGRGFLFLPHPRGADAQVLYAFVDGRRIELYDVGREVYVPRYARTGHILYVQPEEPSGIWALPFDVDRLEVTGEPLLVVPDGGDFTISDRGDLLYTSGASVFERGEHLVWVDRTGAEVGRVGPTLYGASGPSISPDGTRVALSASGLHPDESDDDLDIWIVDLRRGTPLCLAADPDDQRGCSWSADGRRIAYLSGAGVSNIEVGAILARAADGSGSPELLADHAWMYTLDDDWSTIAVTTGENLVEDSWISVQRTGDDATRREIVNGPDWDIAPLIRPGGGLIAYIAGKPMTDTMQLLIRRFPDGAGRWPLSTVPIGRFAWSRTGDRLYFLGGDEKTPTMMEMTVTLRDDGTVELGEETPLFALDESDGRDFDVDADGERFLFIKRDAPPEGADAEKRLILVENWAEGFRDRSR